MPEQENKALVRRYFEEVRNLRHSGIVSEIFAPDVIVHVDTPAGSEAIRGVSAIRQTLTAYLRAFPDLRFTIEDQLADGERVATRWQARGTHQGELMGVAATGKSIAFGGIDVYRVVDGKIAEVWTSYDRLVVLQQIGAAPMPSHGAT